MSAFVIYVTKNSTSDMHSESFTRLKYISTTSSMNTSVLLAALQIGAHLP